MTKVFNRHQDLEKRRVLRRTSSPIERMVWQRLRDNQVAGAKWKRQYSVGQFVLDFYCPEVWLAIELDGSSHDGERAVEYDKARQEWIETYQIEFLRFSNQEVRQRLDSVIGIIAAKIEERRKLNIKPRKPLGS